MPSETGNAEQTYLTIRVPAVVVKELRAVAAENDRSLSAEARLALKAWLAQYAERAA